VLRNGRRSCPNCRARIEPGEHIWCWGQYSNGKWRNVSDCCKTCFGDYVRDRLVAHTDECGCTVELVGYHGDRLPAWLTLAETGACAAGPAVSAT
jgi:hypothetical protein